MSTIESKFQALTLSATEGGEQAGKEAEQLAADVRHEIEKLMSALVTKERLLQHLDASNMRLRRDAAGLRASNRHLVGENTQLMADAEACRNHSFEGAAWLREQCSRFDDENRQLRRDYASLHAENRDLRQANATLNEENAALLQWNQGWQEWWKTKQGGGLDGGTASQQQSEDATVE